MTLLPLSKSLPQRKLKTGKLLGGFWHAKRRGMTTRGEDRLEEQGEKERKMAAARMLIRIQIRMPLS